MQAQSGPAESPRPGPDSAARPGPVEAAIPRAEGASDAVAAEPPGIAAQATAEAAAGSSSSAPQSEAPACPVRPTAGNDTGLESALRLSAAAPQIQWYPGHIAKAEKALNQQLDRVDLVVEVRDARIPLATGHPRLQRWIRGRQHLLVLNRLDMVTPQARQAWTDWFRSQSQTVWWCDARAGTGVRQLQQAAIRSCEALNARRLSRGMRPRPVRALMLGFPNVGKSALINRLVGQKVVDSGRRAGVTRSLRWVRLGQDLDLLDAPGVLPPRLDDQRAALRLALCDDIGQAAYDTEAVGLALLRLLVLLEPNPAAGVTPGLLQQRYGVATSGPGSAAEPQAPMPPRDAAPLAMADPTAWLQAAAARHTSGDSARMAQRLLDDFRRGLLGPIALELP